MTYIMIDVESDGPIPGDYSMVCFGAIVVEPSLDRTFYGRLKPISVRWIPEALAVTWDLLWLANRISHSDRRLLKVLVGYLSVVVPFLVGLGFGRWYCWHQIGVS